MATAQCLDEGSSILSGSESGTRTSKMVLRISQSSYKIVQLDASNCRKKIYGLRAQAETYRFSV